MQGCMYVRGNSEKHLQSKTFKVFTFYSDEGFGEKIKMDRIEKVRVIVDDILLKMTDVEERRCAYIHLYGVAQACALLAKKRNGNIEFLLVNLN